MIRTLLSNDLEQADKILFSYQCPYLALAHVFGFVDGNHIRNFPSSFTRLSLGKMITFRYGNGYKKISNDIFHLIEDGYSLAKIAEIIK
jgi:hypothetical protein